MRVRYLLNHKHLESNWHYMAQSYIINVLENKPLI